MAAAAVPSRDRESSARPGCDASDGASGPALTLDFQFPPHYTSNENYAFPPRRRSVPYIGSVQVGASNVRPRSAQCDPSKQLGSNYKSPDSSATGIPTPEASPDYITSSGAAGIRSNGRVVGEGVLPTVLNATVRLGPVPGRSHSHTREASELLQVPMLEPKTEEKKPIVRQERAPPPPGVNMRRGHAHRRSGAISSSDVWSLMNAPPPALPVPKAVVADGPNGLSPGPSPKLTSSAPVSPKVPTTESGPASQEPSNDSNRHSRVCFTEEVEIIPTQNSPTTASARTTPPSAGTKTASDLPPRIPSPPRRQNRTRSNSQTLAMPTAALRAQSDRPSTAGAILSSVPPPAKPLELNMDEVSTLKRPASESPFMNSEFSPVKQPPSKKAHKKAQSDFSPFMDSGEFKPDNADCDPSTEKKKKKGKKQIKNWAGNILGKGKLKHSRHRKSKSKRAPTPPLSRSAEDLGPAANEWVATSWNESYVMMPIDTASGLETQKVTVSGGIGSPIIDLDAALGPFKSPVETHTGFAAARRRMHSAASRNGNAYFHRRSESMPEMQLFALEEDEDRTMEDVFEEEDEDETTSEEESDEDEDEPVVGNGLGIGIQAEDWPRNVHVSHAPATTTDKRLSTGTITAVTVSTNPPVAEEVESRSPSPRRKAAPADIITPDLDSAAPDAPFRHSFIGPALDSPSTFVTAASSPNTPAQSDFPEEPFNPYRDYLGEPGPEMRLSADDIPSLTSSSSTMTLNAAYLGMPSTPGASDTLPSPAISPQEKKDKEKDKGKKWSRLFAFWKTK